MGAIAVLTTPPETAPMQKFWTKSGNGAALVVMHCGWLWSRSRVVTLAFSHPCCQLALIRSSACQDNPSHIQVDLQTEKGRQNKQL
mmetsp:Transcript_19398/g.35135  ORF Transcript_19398/g.35135 Transcript_19398/m.35135 type:complete len:86 (-) Transcript_19398:7-264(-)